MPGVRQLVVVVDADDARPDREAFTWRRCADLTEVEVTADELGGLPMAVEFTEAAEDRMLVDGFSPSRASPLEARARDYGGTFAATPRGD
jgi:hypothetical protein